MSRISASLSAKVSEAALLCTLETQTETVRLHRSAFVSAALLKLALMWGEPLGLKMIPTSSFAEKSDQASRFFVLNRSLRAASPRPSGTGDPFLFLRTGAEAPAYSRSASPRRGRFFLSVGVLRGKQRTDQLFLKVILLVYCNGPTPISLNFVCISSFSFGSEALCRAFCNSSAPARRLPCFAMASPLPAKAITFCGSFASIFS